MEIRNENDLLNALNPVLDEVVKDMADEILSILWDFIRKDVYDAYNEPSVYQRADSEHNFLNSWIKEVERKGRRKEVIATIFNSPRLMSLDIENYVHGSPESHDFRQGLAQAIEEGLGGHYWFPEYREDGSINPAYVERPFFEDTVTYLEKSGYLFKLFEDKMAKRGLHIHKSGSSEYWKYAVSMRLLNYGIDD